MSAGCGKHLANVAFISRTAGRAAFGLVGIAFCLEEFLALNAEDERSAAIGTFDRLVLKCHESHPNYLI